MLNIYSTNTVTPIIADTQWVYTCTHNHAGEKSLQSNIDFSGGRGEDGSGWSTFSMSSFDSNFHEWTPFNTSAPVYGAGEWAHR